MCKGVDGWSKLDCCDADDPVTTTAGCTLFPATTKWSIVLLISVGFAFIVIGLILAVLQITEHTPDNYSLVHSVTLIGNSYSTAFCSV